MGRPPDFEDYEEGVPCPNCHDDLFHGKTPKYVEVVFAGLGKCIPSPYPPPDGTYLLEQYDLCVWRYWCHPYLIVWTLAAGTSHMRCYGPFGTWFFIGNELGWCATEFFNITGPCSGPVHARGGIAKVFWGPTIGPQSSFIQWEVGDPCCVCQSKIFSGYTPKYAYAKVLGLKRCPFASREPPDGEYLMTQATPCVWQGVHDVFTFVWNIVGPGSSFLIHDEVGNLYFSATDPKPCRAFFANELNCFPLTEWTYEGGVKIKWGPWPERPE